MPVHNALPYLDEAIESILDQTYSDFEFVILDDASTDGSTERLREWAARDSRIRLMEVKKNLGPALSSQKVASEASAPIVARMDADDISHPERLRKQLELLQRHPEVGLGASLNDLLDRNGKTIREPEPWRVMRRSAFVPFAHGAIMYRRELFDHVGGYREECEYWEDQDLTVRIGAISKIMVLLEGLYQVRQSAVSTRVRSDLERLERAAGMMYCALGRMEKGQDYEHILQEGWTGGKLDPRVFIALGAVTLWAGCRPRLFRRLLARARLSFDSTSLTAIVWTAWASLSPSTLRTFMQLLLVVRNALVSRSVAPNEAVIWSPWPTSAVEAIACTISPIGSRGREAPAGSDVKFRSRPC